MQIKFHEKAYGLSQHIIIVIMVIILWEKIHDFGSCFSFPHCIAWLEASVWVQLWEQLLHTMRYSACEYEKQGQRVGQLSCSLYCDPQHTAVPSGTQKRLAFISIASVCVRARARVCVSHIPNTNVCICPVLVLSLAVPQQDPLCLKITAECQLCYQLSVHFPDFLSYWQHKCRNTQTQIRDFSEISTSTISDCLISFWRPGVLSRGSWYKCARREENLSAYYLIYCYQIVKGDFTLIGTRNNSTAIINTSRWMVWTRG